MRRSRPIEVESVFGYAKYYFGVRFILNGLEKVMLNYNGLHCIAPTL